MEDIHSTELADEAPFTNRGFTDHEHLDDAELIHMNGRAYDYNLGRFLSVDPFIQAPGNSQSMNPYSYIMNNPLSGTDPSGYKAECEQALGKGCGDDEPKKERREKRGQGFSQDWKTVYQVDNGADVIHSVNAKGSTEEVEKIGSELKDKGYELTSGRSNSDGTVEASYTKSYSGGLDEIEGQISDSLRSISDIAMVSGLAADAGGQFLGVAGSAKVIPQFSPAGGVAGWSATWGSANGRAFMQVSALQGLGSRLRVASKALGLGALVGSTIANGLDPNYSKSDVVWKLGADSAIGYIAFKAASYGRFGGLVGLGVGVGYAVIDYHVNQTYGGWTGFANYHVREFQSGVSTFRHNMNYIQQEPHDAMHRMFNVPNTHFNMGTRQ
ncbi:RHS repeat-associated core domain-containing protein [Kangiella sediminilitoris]|uniref:YD repeat-containing protein n=1 Tax=Kangiella sediminilitoris TaxID=1144748 RepID=A0A1B3BA60_9GAMM|nr:RHS repeat-associated core domain-containing protein [Kangiella sediminilitoris]AOE49634.1 YD repeat-containing protein [Kangiella sediminilitoris]